MRLVFPYAHSLARMCALAQARRALLRTAVEVARGLLHLHEMVRVRVVSCRGVAWRGVAGVCMRLRLGHVHMHMYAVHAWTRAACFPP